MTPLSPLAANWGAISALLDVALDMQPSDRPAWLDGLTGEPARHRGALRTLLAHQGEVEAGGFLTGLPRFDLADASPPVDRLVAGGNVGAYRLIAEIGQGGMGTVWLAERADGLMKRRVALKLPRIVWGDTFAERLAHEREILASLENEHIARLYDAGIDAHGRPFLAMEYVEGEPIDIYCRNHSLTVRERLPLLLQVMAAVSHAHSRLVVHRDLKPGNILVAKGGQVKLLDFGIAKLLEGDSTHRSALTELSGHALTLDYASPEQIRGEPLGTGSDVYSLGVVAYELLARARPYRLKRGSAAEMEEAIAAMEPRLASDAADAAEPAEVHEESNKPSNKLSNKQSKRALRNQLRGDLDSILNRALKKNVAERYLSVDAFAQDMLRHLRGEPVQARPDTRRYRAAKFIRRNRVAVAMTSALAASILVGSGMSLWQARVARQQERVASAEVTRQGAVRDLYVEAMMRLSVMRSEQPDAVDGPTAVTRALQEVLHEMAPRLKNEPEGREAQLEAVMLQLLNNNEYDASLAVGMEYLGALKAHLAPAFRIIDAHIALGRNLALLGRQDEAEAMRRAGVAWATDDHDPRTELSRLNLVSDLGRTLIARGKRDEAEALLLQAEAVAQRMFPNELLRYDNLMQLWIFWSDFDDARALPYARQAYAGLLAAGTADADEKAIDLRYLGTALSAVGLSVEAEAAWRESLAIYVRAYGRGSAKSVDALGRVADALSRQGAYARAAALLSEEAQVLSAMPEGVAASASRALRARQLENAWLSGDTRSASTWLASDRPDWLTPAALRNNQLQMFWEARALELTGHQREALALVTASRKAWPEPGRPTSWWIRMLEMQASLQLAAGDPADARDTARSLLAMLDQQHATGGRAYRAAAEMAALAAARLGDKADAADAAQAFRLASTGPAPAFPSPVERAESALRRAETLAALGRSAESASAGHAALADLAAQHPDSPRLAQARRFAGMVGR